MALLEPINELDIREGVAGIFDSPEAHLFTVPRQITSKQHFIANTVKTILGKTEVRYVEFYMVGFTDLNGEAQLDADCVPVRINYEGQVGFQHVEKRSDNSCSFDSVVAFIIDLRNRFLNNQEITVKGRDFEVGRITELAKLRIENHPVSEFDTHLWDFSFYVEVRN